MPKGSVREATEKSSLCRGLISTNFHNVGYYWFLFPSLSGHRAGQAEAGGRGPVICLSGRAHRCDCSGASCTCSHNQRNGEESQGRVQVASTCWSPCHPSQIKATAAKPEELSETAWLKSVSHLRWKMSAVQRHNIPDHESSGCPIWDVYRYTSSDLKSIVSCWCSGAYRFGWLHCFLI